MMPLYRAAIPILSLLCRIGGVKVYGKDNIPSGEVPLVVVGNHASMADPILVGYALLPRQVYFVAKKEFSEKFLIGGLFAKLGAIYVDRGEADIVAIKRSVKVLKENNVLGIFAEGKRHKGEGLADFKQGPVFIAHRGNAIILPVGIRNAANIFKFWKRDAAIYIGEPIMIDKSQGDLHELMDRYTDDLKQQIGTLCGKVE